jgi:glycosyltransferase involved in cell wall biosynthesis
VPDAQLVLMGGEPFEIERLRVKAASHGLGERCVFAGKRPPAELPAFLALADVLASPRAKGENTPFKIYTYLASGKPIVATRIATHTQLLDDTTAFLVEPTPAAFGAGLREALARRGEALERAGRGYALVQREYGIERYREKIARAYAEVERLVGLRYA